MHYAIIIYWIITIIIFVLVYIVLAAMHLLAEYEFAVSVHCMVNSTNL